MKDTATTGSTKKTTGVFADSQIAYAIRYGDRAFWSRPRLDNGEPRVNNEKISEFYVDPDFYEWAMKYENYGIDICDTKRGTAKFAGLQMRPKVREDI